MEEFVQLDLSRRQRRTRADVEASPEDLRLRARVLRRQMDDGSVRRELRDELTRLTEQADAERKLLRMMGDQTAQR